MLYIAARVRFCLGYNKSKGSVRVLHKDRKFGFRSYILSFEFGSMRVCLCDGFKFNCTSVITKSFNAICKLM